MTGRDIVLTCCRDEEDIIEVFVQYYLWSGFNAVHVVDNGSRDGSVARVRALAARGLAVTLDIDPRDGYERYLTDWFRNAGRNYEPRWLFFLDCDEFILFPGKVQRYLDSLPPGVNRLRLHQKEMYSGLPPDPRPGGMLMSRRAEPRFNETTKDVVRWNPQGIVYGGKHRIDVPSPTTFEPRDIFIRHYKYRTPEQAYRKEVNRVAVARTYSQDELAAISAFGLDASLAWREECRRALAAEHWRESFSMDLASIDDPEMAECARRFLPTLIAREELPR